MTDPARAARYTDLFGRDPGLVAEGEEEPPNAQAEATPHQHAHTSDCAYCPICASIAVVRNVKPEVLDHLAAAAREFLMAATLLVEEAGKVVGVEVPPTDDASVEDPPTPSNVRRLDLG
ncbi:MAG: hypothetical protein LC808_41335 [Actinobacteria bacterium]|nr:hypothetical protein [Actinomycetota bacterium]